MIETVIRESRRSNGGEKAMSQVSQFRGSPNTQVSAKIQSITKLTKISCHNKKSALLLTSQFPTIMVPFCAVCSL